MSKTYEKLLSQIDLSAPRFECEEFGTMLVYDHKSKISGLYSATVIESFKSKKFHYVRALTVEQLQNHFKKLVEVERKMKERRDGSAIKNKARAKEFLSKLQVGAILRGSWGYEQTNVEFFIIREIKGNKVKMQELGHKDVEDKQTGNSMASYVMPDLDRNIGEVINGTVGSWGIKLHDSCTLTIWDGKPEYKSWYY